LLLSLSLFSRIQQYRCALTSAEKFEFGRMNEIIKNALEMGRYPLFREHPISLFKGINDQ